MTTVDNNEATHSAPVAEDGACASAPQRRQTPVAIPDRRYFKIGDVADLVGVETHVLRYWETQFSQVRPQKARSGHRLYRRRDVEHLLAIRELLHVQRFTIAGARQALRAAAVAPTRAMLPIAAALAPLDLPAELAELGEHEELEDVAVDAVRAEPQAEVTLEEPLAADDAALEAAPAVSADHAASEEVLADSDEVIEDPQALDATLACIEVEALDAAELVAAMDVQLAEQDGGAALELDVVGTDITMSQAGVTAPPIDLAAKRAALRARRKLLKAALADAGRITALLDAADAAMLRDPSAPRPTSSATTSTVVETVSANAPAQQRGVG